MNASSKPTVRLAASALLFVFALWAVINAASGFGWNTAPDLPIGPAVSVRGPVTVLSVSPSQTLPSSAMLPGAAGGLTRITTRRWEQADELRRWVECVNAYHAVRRSSLGADPTVLRPWHAYVPDPFGGCGSMPSERWGPRPGWTPVGSVPWSSVGTLNWGASR